MERDSIKKMKSKAKKMAKKEVEFIMVDNSTEETREST